MKTMIFIFVFMLSSIAIAQQVSGKIVDQSNQPLSGASIYYDGSTIGTLSREDGSFKIDYKNQSNLTLVVRYLGFEKFYLSNPNPQNSYKIVLIPEENRLDEVVLDASIFTRNEMLKAFKRDFLGETKAGKRAEILNEEDIRFYYDKEKKSLNAWAGKPLQIINKELGYKVEFDLVNFISNFNKVTLDKDYQKTNYFVGTSYFQSKSEITKRIKRKRLKAYLGSSMHFFKSLCRGKLNEEQFQFFHKSFQVPFSKIFEVKKLKHQVQEMQTFKNGYEIKILGNDFENINKNYPVLQDKFQKKVAVLHKGDRSDITFKTKVFYVDDFGNHTNINEILFDGEMSKGRMGGMLPVNYQPNE